MGGCSVNQNQEVKVSPSISAVPEKEKKSVVFNLKPLPVQPPTLEEMESSQDMGSNVLVNFSFDDMDLKKVLLALGKATGYNVIVPPDIEGKVSIELKEETLENSLNSLLKPFGYSYRIDGKNIYVVSKETKVFHTLGEKLSYQPPVDIS